METCKMCGVKEATAKNSQGDLIMCQDCFGEWKHDQAVIKRLERSGHTYHCACRQVWGDGECECSKDNWYNPDA